MANANVGARRQSTKPDRNLYRVVFDMENDVLDIGRYSRALYMMATAGAHEGFDSDDYDALLCIANKAIVAANGVKEAWEQCFELTKVNKC